MLAVAYGLYSLIRNAAPGQEGAAVRRARRLLALERRLGIDVELVINQATARIGWLTAVMNYYYATLHFLVTLTVLVWLYLRRPEHYRHARTVLCAATVLALAGFYLFALAPPRLLPAEGFIDTLTVHRTWGSVASDEMAGVSNQYAAMPSVHVVWAVWSGLVVVRAVRRGWIRVLGVCHPISTVVVILATANHFVLDVIAGLVVFAGGACLHRLMTRSRTVPAVPAGERAGGPSSASGPGRTSTARTRQSRSTARSGHDDGRTATSMIRADHRPHGRCGEQFRARDESPFR